MIIVIVVVIIIIIIVVVVVVIIIIIIIIIIITIVIMIVIILVSISLVYNLFFRAGVLITAGTMFAFIFHTFFSFFDRSKYLSVFSTSLSSIFVL